MKVSVVMSVFNDAAHVSATVESILAQTERDFELIIVDDGSTDDTPAILAGHAARDSRIRVITQQNAGLTRALITGCAAARAPLIARQDSGDISYPERLEKQIALFERWPDLVFASCFTDVTGPELEYLYTTRGGAIAESPASILDGIRVVDGPSAHPTVMFRRDAYERVGGYRAEFYYGQDWDLWYRLAEAGPFARVPEALVSVRLTADSISATARERQQKIAAFSEAAFLARSRGESDAEIIAQAASIRPARRRAGRRQRAAGLYFIGAALYRNGDRRARFYLFRAARTWPLSPRTWLRTLQSLRLR